MEAPRSVLGRQFIRSRYARSATQRARSRHQFGSYGAEYRLNKKMNQQRYRSRRRPKWQS